MTVSTPTETELARDFALSMLSQAGLGAWQDIEFVDKVGNTSAYLAALIQSNLEISDVTMAVTAVFRTQEGTSKTIKGSGGDAVLTFTSLANGSMRQSGTLDLGATHAALYLVELAIEIAATPTAGNVINGYVSDNQASGAGWANTTGSDAAYTGYSSNAAASIKQLDFIGALVCTAQATTTVQKGIMGVFPPKGRYINFVIDNESGAAFHSSQTNCSITLTPIEDTSEPA